MKDSGVLLSGGMDSIALTWWKRPQIAFTIDYGQVCAAGEIRAASAVAQRLGLQHEVIAVDCRAVGSGDLAGTTPLEAAPVQEWWPFRNQLLVTIAAMRAIELGIRNLLFGAVASDATHTDGTAAFFEKLNELLSLQEGKLEVKAPATGLTSVELIRTSGVPQGLLGWAHSCHRSEYACGTCRGCAKHLSVTAQLWGTAY
jgi:7-cyano-7-deazaguanine synthase